MDAQNNTSAQSSDSHTVPMTTPSSTAPAASPYVSQVRWLEAITPALPRTRDDAEFGLTVTTYQIQGVIQHFHSNGQSLYNAELSTFQYFWPTLPPELFRGIDLTAGPTASTGPSSGAEMRQQTATLPSQALAPPTQAATLPAQALVERTRPPVDSTGAQEPITVSSSGIKTESPTPKMKAPTGPRKQEMSRRSSSSSAPAGNPTPNRSPRQPPTDMELYRPPRSSSQASRNMELSRANAEPSQQRGPLNNPPTGPRAHPHPSHRSNTHGKHNGPEVMFPGIYAPHGLDERGAPRHSAVLFQDNAWAKICGPKHSFINQVNAQYPDMSVRIERKEEPSKVSVIYVTSDTDTEESRRARVGFEKGLRRYQQIDHDGPPNSLPYFHNYHDENRHLFQPVNHDERDRPRAVAPPSQYDTDGDNERRDGGRGGGLDGGYHHDERDRPRAVAPPSQYDTDGDSESHDGGRGGGLDGGYHHDERDRPRAVAPPSQYDTDGDSESHDGGRGRGLDGGYHHDERDRPRAVAPPSQYDTVRGGERSDAGRGDRRNGRSVEGRGERRDEEDEERRGEGRGAKRGERRDEEHSGSRYRKRRRH